MGTLNGILLVNKSKGSPSFDLIRKLRKITNISKIGHCGTLDPFATGVMILLIGKRYTRQATEFIHLDKEYIATIVLGKATDTYDIDGQTTFTSAHIPNKEELENVLKNFQGVLKQKPPMFSAKKIQGKRLYELARKGITIDRPDKLIELKTELLSYEYPYVKLRIECSKGTYIRSIAHEIGEKLTCGAHATSLVRTRIGPYHLKACIDEELLSENCNLSKYIIE